MAARAPAARAIQEFHYRISTPARGEFPGHHKSPRGASGFEFRGHANLLDAPDPRRLDMHASLRDPFGHWIVRIYAQRKSIPVIVVADVSASMAFGSGQRKLDVAADFAESAAWSAFRTGDAFGFVACDSVVRNDFLLLPSRARGLGTTLAERLRQFTPTGRTAAGLQLAHRQLGRQRALVFLVSDFHLPPADLAPLLASFAQHELVPIVIEDRSEFELGARRGLASIADPETGEQRLVWWRPALRERWAAAREARHVGLLAAFRAQRLRPLFLASGFRADTLTRHFHS